METDSYLRQWLSFETGREGDGRGDIRVRFLNLSIYLNWFEVSLSYLAFTDQLNGTVQVRCELSLG